MLTRLATVLAAISLVGCASVDPAISNSPAVDHKDVPFKLGRSCFSGTRASYDDWAASMVSKNEDTDLSTFRTRFPEADYDEYKSHLDCHFISYPVGNLTIRGFYIRPKGHEGNDLPVLIANRGGNGPSGTWKFGSLFQWAMPLADAGFVVLGSQYRGSRRGDDPSIYGADEFGGADVDDVMALIDLINRLPGADGTRVGMYGWSRGGMMTLLAATRTDRLKAIAVGGTPTDLVAELAVRPEMERVFRARIPGYDENKQAALEARSAIHWVDTIDPRLPILILHGEHDNRVSLGSAQKLAKMLQELKRPHRLVAYEDGSHALLERNQEVIDELLIWFDKHLAASK